MQESIEIDSMGFIFSIFWAATPKGPQIRPLGPQFRPLKPQIRPLIRPLIPFIGPLKSEIIEEEEM